MSYNEIAQPPWSYIVLPYHVRPARLRRWLDACGLRLLASIVTRVESGWQHAICAVNLRHVCGYCGASWPHMRMAPRCYAAAVREIVRRFEELAS